MIEITKSNFLEMLPQIYHDINKADFIAIDAEFTGLFLNEKNKPSIFDNLKERYIKLKTNVQNFTLSQIGITIFRNDGNGNRYEAKTYSFYLCPISFGCDDETICFQTSCIQFLSRHRFDFNKCFRYGISYFNSQQEQKLMEHIENGSLVSFCELDNRELNDLCSHITSWILTAKIGDCMSLSMLECSTVTLYAIEMELKNRFPQIWTNTNSFDQLVVELIDVQKRKSLEAEENYSRKEKEMKLLLDVEGFTAVFRQLVKAKKPLVGHNCLMDLMYMYQKFHSPLPDSFKSFKEEVHRIFPLVFDTKHMAYGVLKTYPGLDSSKGEKSLQDLHQYLSSQEVVRLCLIQPSVYVCSAVDDGEAKAAHHAGYDSFMCGFVFIRLCHLIHHQGASAMNIVSCPFQSYLPSLKKYKNCVNVIRATIKYMKLDGDDPSSNRPPLLNVNARSGYKICSQKLTMLFSPFGTIDIRMKSSRQALVACSSFSTARAILKNYKGHKEIKVDTYRFLKHSTFGKSIFWGLITVTVSVCAGSLYNIVKK